MAQDKAAQVQEEDNSVEKCNKLHVVLHGRFTLYAIADRNDTDGLGLNGGGYLVELYPESTEQNITKSCAIVLDKYIEKGPGEADALLQMHLLEPHTERCPLQDLLLGSECVTSEQEERDLKKQRRKVKIRIDIS